MQSFSFMASPNLPNSLNIAQWLWPLPSGDEEGSSSELNGPADITRAQQVLINVAASRAVDVLRYPFYRPWGNVIKPVAINSTALAIKDKENENDNEKEGKERIEVAIPFLSRVPAALELQIFPVRNPSGNGEGHPSSGPLYARCGSEKSVQIISNGVRAQVLGSSPWHPYSHQASVTFRKTAPGSGGLLNKQRRFKDPCTLTLGRYSWQFGFRGPSSPSDRPEDFGLVGSSPWRCEGDPVTEDNFFSNDFMTDLHQHDMTDLGLNGSTMAPASSVATFQLERASSVLEPFSSSDWAVYLSNSPSSLSTPEKDSWNVHLSGTSTDENVTAEQPKLSLLQESCSEPSADQPPPCREAGSQSESSTGTTVRVVVEEPVAKKPKREPPVVPSEITTSTSKQSLGSCVCVECGKKFDMPQALGGHMSTHRRNKSGKVAKAQQSIASQRQAIATVFSDRFGARGQKAPSAYQQLGLFGPGLQRNLTPSLPSASPSFFPSVPPTAGISVTTTSGQVLQPMRPDGMQPYGNLPSHFHSDTYFSGFPTERLQTVLSSPSSVQWQSAPSTTTQTLDVNDNRTSVLQQISDLNKQTPVRSSLAGKIIQFGGQLYRLRPVEAGNQIGGPGNQIASHTN